jgi:hypothetical protein
LLATRGEFVVRRSDHFQGFVAIVAADEWMAEELKASANRRT